MARETLTVSTPLLQNILNQPEALRTVAEYQFGAGRPALLRAAELLRTKKRILLSGMGASHFACMPFEYIFSERGWGATSIETAELLYFLSSSIDKDTALILVSRSGESVEVLKLLPVAKERGAVVIAIANVPESALSREAEETILMNSPADQLVAIQTYTATVVTLALLCAALFNELDQARAELDRTLETLSTFVPEYVKVSENWREFLNGDAPLYLLGRGPALGSVAEGVLLMHEVAKASGIGMSVPQFRHGPVEVVDRRFRGIIIGSQEETARLDAALTDDLGRMGGQVRWIGPPVDGAKLISLCSWPVNLPQRFQSLLEVVPLQMAAYRKAEICGVSPGEFRWAPAITTTEAGFSCA